MQPGERRPLQLWRPGAAHRPSASLAGDLPESWQRTRSWGPSPGSGSGGGWRLDPGVCARCKYSSGSCCGVPAHRLALTGDKSCPVAACSRGSGVLALAGSGDENCVARRWDCEHPGVVAACREVWPNREGSRSSNHWRWLDPPGFRRGQRWGPCFDASLIRPSLRAHRLVVLSHLFGNNRSGDARIERWPAAEHHPRHPWLLVECRPVGGVACRWRRQPSCGRYLRLTGHKWCCGPEGLGGVACRSEILSAFKTDAGGKWRSLAMRTMPALMGPGVDMIRGNTMVARFE